MKPTDTPISVSLPVAALTFLGTVVAVLGLIVAGDLLVVGLGLGAIAVAGVIGIFERRGEPPSPAKP